MFDNFLPIPDAESVPFYPLVLKLVVCVPLSGCCRRSQQQLVCDRRRRAHWHLQVAAATQPAAQQWQALAAICHWAETVCAAVPDAVGHGSCSLGWIPGAPVYAEKKSMREGKTGPRNMTGTHT